MVHECGHFLSAKVCGIETKQITLYPLGGISKMEIDMNENPFIEGFIIIMGPLFQVIAYCILIYLFPDKEIIKRIHYGILSFNLLPIYPLDGGRFLNLFMNIILPYKKSFYISIMISYCMTIIILFNQIKLSINIFIIYIVLMSMIHKEELKSNLYFQKFLLERYLKKYRFHKDRIITHIENMYRYQNNVIKEENRYISEKDYLIQKYEKIDKKC